jgi:uncharacterized protein (DUF1800 family)
MEAARCLTGWTVRDRHGLRKASVEFHRGEHDDGRKLVLGVEIPGRRRPARCRDPARLVARHPSTAQHVATKLCRRFVATIRRARGRERSRRPSSPARRPPRHAARALRAARVPARPELAACTKLKRPFHYAVSMLRATDAATDAGPALAGYLARMGQAPFQYPTPDGYPEEAGAWQGALFWRWKLALALAGGRVQGTRIDTQALLERCGSAEDLAAHLLGRRMQPQERAIYLADGKPHLGLLLASPDFQRC